MIPGGLKAVIHKGTWPVLPVFKLISEMGNIGETDMFNTFNMGIGMVLAVDNDQAGEIISFIGELGEKAYLIGEITEGEGRIEIC